jgi:hypothetical protein
MSLRQRRAKAQLAAAVVCWLVPSVEPSGLVPSVGSTGLVLGSGELARESAVLEAVFRQQIGEHLDATARAARTVVCLAVDPGGAPQSPSRELMARLATDAAVRRAAECDPRPEGAVEATTLRPAIIVTAGPIDWVAADDAWVAVSFFQSAQRSARRRYRVVRERAGWVSLGPILIDGPP